MSVTDLLRDKSKKINLHLGLKTLSSIMIRTTKADGKDYLKDPNLQTQLMNILKALVKIEQGKNFI